jgi:hypothetical protein
MSMEPIDAVITWVDGYDENHKQKLENYLNQAGICKRTPSVAPTRFNQHNEVNFCIRSLLAFTPWIRTIFLVTDSQRPPVLRQFCGTPYESKIQIIDHREIFFDFEDYLPTFNSLSIETVLWRIPNLSNRFIYLNDDCVIIRPLSREDFFGQTHVVLRGEWKMHVEKKWRSRLRPLLFKSVVAVSEHRTVQENSAKLVGYEKYFFHLPHVPFPLRKDTLKFFFQNQPDLLKRNIAHRIRSIQQFWPISLAVHLEIQNKLASFDRYLKAIALNPACHSFKKIQKKLVLANKKNNIAFLCIQSMDAAKPSIRFWMLNWLEQRIPSVETIVALSNKSKS